MRIKLEYDDGPVFATVKVPVGRGLSDYRALTVKINGKPFSTWVNYSPFYSVDEHYLRMIDEQLIASMERIFEKIFMDACAAVKEGTDLLVE